MGRHNKKFLTANDDKADIDLNPEQATGLRLGDPLKGLRTFLSGLDPLFRSSGLGARSPLKTNSLIGIVISGKKKQYPRQHCAGVSYFNSINPGEAAIR